MAKMRIARRALFSLPFAWTLHADDDFWVAKQADAWTIQEAEKLLSKSPWAETMTVARGALVEGTNVEPARGRRGVVIAHTVDLVIRWMSAEPMRLALGKVAGAGGAQQKRAESLAEASYVVVVKGVPLGVMQLSGETRASLERSAELRIPGRDPIKVSRMGFARDGGSADIRFAFPRVESLTVADKNVEFRFELGRAKIRHKFDLNKMTYKGELAL